MVLTSGNPPYEYAVRKLPFKVPNPYASNAAIGGSGILLEQAQFIVTAEIRKFTKFDDSSFLPDFFVYVNPVITPSGPYEPKANGSTLGNLLNPEGLIFIDPIIELRNALELMFFNYAQDTTFFNNEVRSDWLQNAYPQSASGFYDDQATDIGFYRHREPSETGPILYNSDEVLGSSGVLFDIDYGEVMFQPYPYIARALSINPYGRRSNNSVTIYNIQGMPIWPDFQKTTGAFTGTNGREPTNGIGLSTEITRHIGSGKIRLDGYVLLPSSTYSIGDIFSFPYNFPHTADGVRQVFDGGNVGTSRVFITPIAAASGVYRMLAKNYKVNVPLTAVESGTISIWPRVDNGRYYGTAQGVINYNTIANENSNNGYHVFDSTIWMTDRTPTSTDFPSGLVIVSPWTGHQLWLRYADQNSGILGSNWSTHIGLERPLTNVIYRSHPQSIAGTTSPFLQTYSVHQYNDMLDYIGDFTSDGNPNTPPLVGGQEPVTDLFTDGTSYFFLGAAGSGLTQLNNTFTYVSSWAFESNAGPGQGSGTGSRAFFGNGNYYFYIPEQGGVGVGGYDMQSSGILQFSFGAANRLNFVDMKLVRGEKYFGARLPLVYRYDDIIEVISSPHLTPGIWAMVSIAFPGDSILNNYLMRIEEKTDYWEVQAIMRVNSSSTPDALGNFGTVDMLFMDI
jgi:hypothetical protein